jgi:class 3 adenylate cyclase
MRGLLIHAVVYGVVNALLVGVWLVTTGSTDVLNDAQTDPLGAFRDGMWPLAVMAAWGGGLVIHAAVVITSLPARVLRRRVAPPPPIPPAAPSAPAGPWGHTTHVGHDVAQQAMRAAFGFVENLGNRAGTGKGDPQEPHRPWITAMFTDLVGSTVLAERLGDAAWHTLLAEHRALVRRCLDAHGGTEIGTQGDGFLMRFPTSDAAVRCAIDIQREMALHRDSGELTPDLRIGIHAGEAVADDNDLVGKVINLASRVTSAAAPNEIVVTEPVADHASPGLLLTDRGLVSLKGIAQPRHLLAVEWHPDANRPAPSSHDEDSAGQNVSGES